MQFPYQKRGYQPGGTRIRTRDVQWDSIALTCAPILLEFVLPPSLAASPVARYQTWVVRSPAVRAHPVHQPAWAAKGHCGGNPIAYRPPPFVASPGPISDARPRATDSSSPHHLARYSQAVMVTPTSATSYAFSADTSWMIESSNMTRITPSSGMSSSDPRGTHMIALAISETGLRKALSRLRMFLISAELSEETSVAMRIYPWSSSKSKYPMPKPVRSPSICRAMRKAFDCKDVRSAGANS